jgi:hypothetical protein
MSFGRGGNETTCTCAVDGDRCSDRRRNVAKTRKKQRRWPGNMTTVRTGRLGRALAARVDTLARRTRTDVYVPFPTVVVVSSSRAKPELRRVRAERRGRRYDMRQTSRRRSGRKPKTDGDRKLRDGTVAMLHCSAVYLFIRRATYAIARVVITDNVQ